MDKRVIPIGGYFSLELPKYEEFHKEAIRLNTGRNCLEYIFRVRKYKKVYIPYYTCEVILEPLQKLNIPYEFYHINFYLELTHEIKLNTNEALLYTNYFGLKQRYVEQLVEKYQGQLIVDNTQAFYAKPFEGIDTFYTCRKFFGVPDGAYLNTSAKLDEDFEQDYSYNRMTHLLKRIDLSAEDGFADFRRNDDNLNNQPIRRMSALTQRMMQSIDYGRVAQQRRENYSFLHRLLGTINKLSLPLDDEAVPMAYPFLASIEGLREKLIENKVFVPRYWPNVLDWTAKDEIEYRLTCQMQPLPIDQRYGAEEIKRIVDIINQ